MIDYIAIIIEEEYTPEMLQADGKCAKINVHIYDWKASAFFKKLNYKSAIVFSSKIML